jgi:hypothetical protein
MMAQLLAAWVIAANEKLNQHSLHHGWHDGLA